MTDGGLDREEARRRARESLERILARIAPEVDLKRVDAEAEFRREVDLDSIDVVNVLIGLEEDLDIEIPDVDVSRVTTLDGFLNYLAGRLTEGR